MAEARTEQASPERLARARARGDAPVSPTLTAAVALCAFLAVAASQAPSALRAFEEALHATFTAVASARFEPAHALTAAARLAFTVLAPPLLAACFAAIVIGLVQSSGLLAPGALRGQLDPMGRLRALLSPERALDAVGSAIGLLVLVAVALYTVVPSLPGLLALAGFDLRRALELSAALIWALALRLALAALALGILDSVVRRVRQRQRLRMSRSELKQEQREQYGDPQQRAERMRRARREPGARGGS